MYSEYLYYSFLDSKDRFVYVGAMHNLNNGDMIVYKLIQELKNSKYAKRIALFDEIDKRIKI